MRRSSRSTWSGLGLGLGLGLGFLGLGLELLALHLEALRAAPHLGGEGGALRIRLAAAGRAVDVHARDAADVGVVLAPGEG
eukprot:scaffold32806_cov39-Phaeocystis_antarctica.AAC.1